MQRVGDTKEGDAVWNVEVEENKGNQESKSVFGVEKVTEIAGRSPAINCKLKIMSRYVELRSMRSGKMRMLLNL